MTKITTCNLGVALRDHLEGNRVSRITVDGDQSGDHERVRFVDISDANNPEVQLDNGQRFTIRIFAKGSAP